MKARFLDYLKDEDGQTSTEYILLVAVVAMIVFKFKEIAVEELGKITKNIFDTTNSEITEEFSNF